MKENYLPFFRKYRPQSLKELVGQESLVKALSNAIDLGRIANAYLFCGPRGTGKTSSARILAKSLNCVNGPTLEPCQKCPSCLDITNTSGLDVIEIDAATNRGIADAKELIAQVQYAPMNGKYKIFIIDEVHMLSTEAFNALLKTFEEPPKNVIFILATTEPHKVIETIVSRCQRFDFRRIVIEDIVAKLRDISTLEKIKITDDALFAVAKNVSGGLRDSLALLDQVSILGVREEISKEMIEDLLGKITFDALLNLAKTLVVKDLEGAMGVVENIYSKGNEPRNLCENFMEFLRNAIMVVNAKNPSEVLKFTTLSAQNVDSVLESFKKDELNALMAMLSRVVEFYKEIKNATNPYLWVELLVIELCSSLGVSAPSPVSEVTSVPKKVLPASKPEPLPEPPKPEPLPQPETLATQEVQPKQEPKTPVAEVSEVEPEVESTPSKAPAQEPKTASVGHIDTQSAWSDIVNSIDSIPAKFFFSGVAKLVELTEDAVVVGFMHQNSLLQAKTDSKLQPFERALSAVFEKKPEVRFILITKDTQATSAEVKPQKKPQTPHPSEVQPLEDFVEHHTAPSDSVPASTPPKAPKTQAKSEERQPVSVLYSTKTKEMIENYNGKIID